MELNWLGKKIPTCVEEKRQLVDLGHEQLSIVRQCKLIGLARSSWYATGGEGESADNLALMGEIDRIYTVRPFYGSRRMVVALGGKGYVVNRKRVQRLMRLMGIEGIAPGPSTSRPAPESKIFPYLLRDVPIDRVNQVWSSDITYIPMRRGFLYLTAVIDRFSRYELSWRLSNTLDSSFCVAALEEALVAGTPSIFQHGPGQPIHGSAVHLGVGGGADCDQHGWQGPRSGQRVHRTTVA
jgi:putative transposase